MAAEQWIVVPNWPRFQHYRDREPLWIKLYLELRSRDDWRRLSLAARGLLVCIWIEYAASRGQLRTSDVPARVGQKVHRRTWDLLLQTGFIEISASRPLALRYQPASARARRESREELDPQTPTGFASKPAGFGGSKSNGGEVLFPHPDKLVDRNVCGICGIEKRNSRLLAEHYENVHGVQAGV